MSEKEPDEKQIKEKRGEKPAEKKDYKDSKKVIDEKDEKINELENQTKELINDLQRLQADFENYKKRVERESIEFIKFCNEGLIKRILPVLDSFEIALKNTSNHPDFAKGIQLIYAQLFNMLESFGLRKIETKDQKFNPYYHEVLLTEESEKPEGTILEELQKGYMIHNKVIRHSKVKVSKSKEKEEKTDEKQNKQEHN